MFFTIPRNYLHYTNRRPRFNGSVSKGRNAKYYYYHCISSCGTRFKSENVNELFSRELRKFVPRPGMIEIYANKINAEYKKRSVFSVVMSKR